MVGAEWGVNFHVEMVHFAALWHSVLLWYQLSGAENSLMVILHPFK